MNAKQPSSSLELDLKVSIRPSRDTGPEAFVAKRLSESPTGEIRLMESILERENMRRALRQVRKNDGAPGIDGMTVDELPRYLRRHWDEIKAELLAGVYKPQPVRRKEIEKPDGGVRLLGIPTVLDRLIQQAIAQVLQAIWDHTFSEFSYGFRPGRSQHMAIREARSYIKDGCRWVVDLDLEKFFDRVNHDRLMSRLGTRIRDKRVLKLIGRFLRSGVMIEGLCEATEEGTPQGGPLSPLLSNIVLDELDKELEKRGLQFVRFADDCVIYVKSKRAGDRVKESITRFISRKLKLKVNETKSGVIQPGYSKYLGFGFTHHKAAPKIRIHSKSLQRFRRKVRELTKRTRGRSVKSIIWELNQYLRGWWGYFSLCEAPTSVRKLNAWVLRRLRAYIWKQWKLPKTKLRELRKRGLPDSLAGPLAATRKGPWHISANGYLARALPTRYFTRTLGLVLLG
ncbi:MAG: group II intron reverse transcriptase/maturase [Verrucomicrobia bacterium]|jgi:RNA-directed DNA polymerase|nr:group II intron reverse transcriptase/maturase [Verrucomicrobiota bacterium]